MQVYSNPLQKEPPASLEYALFGGFRGLDTVAIIGVILILALLAGAGGKR